MIEKETKEYGATYFVATAIIRNGDSKLLFVKRSSNGSFEDYWQIPEGKVEKNESPKATMSRELKEETGLETSKVSVILKQTVDFSHRRVGGVYFQRFIFEVEIEPGDIVLSDEHSEYAWMSVEEALGEENLVPGLREVLEYIV